MLPDHEILSLCETEAMVHPLRLDQLEPASYDLRLGNKFRVFGNSPNDHPTVIDIADPEDVTREIVLDDDSYFLLRPGKFVLAHTRERLRIPENIVARIEGKSSIGRLGLIVHVTAGFIDPGFEGNVTLEMTSFHPLPIMLRPGVLIAQVSFQYLSSPCAEPYNGRYQGDDTVVASRPKKVTS